MAQPTSPNMGSMGGLAFPEDIGNVGFYMNFIFSQYRRSSVISNAMTIPTGMPVTLPMPDMINDHPTVVWQPISATEKFISGVEKVAGAALSGMDLSATTRLGMTAIETAAGLGIQAYGAREGKTINPYLIMLFKQPDYKEFRFSWTLTPRTQSESDTLRSIIKEFRKNMQPDVSGPGGAIMDYPYLVKPEFHPSDYMFPFKMCAIRSMNFDYTGAGMPAFFSSNAPVAVKLEMHLIEVDLWMRNEMF